MNADDKIWTKHESKRMALEKRWSKIINEVLLNYCNTAVDYVGERHIIWPASVGEKIKAGEMAFVLVALNLSTTLKFANRNDKQLIKLKSLGDDIPDKWLTETIAYFREHNLKFIEDITDASRERIIAKLVQSQEQGLGTKERAKLLMDEGFNKVRAKRIARTETVRAANYGNLLSAIESDLLLKKKWIAKLDDRVRHSHHNLNGKTLDLYDDFKPGLMFPGDPDAPASETINCRCSLAMVPQRDEDGSLMRKPSPIINIPVQPVNHNELIEEMVSFINLTPGKRLKDIVRSEVYNSVQYLFEWLGLITVFDKIF